MRSLHTCPASDTFDAHTCPASDTFDAHAQAGSRALVGMSRSTFVRDAEWEAKGVPWVGGIPLISMQLTLVMCEKKYDMQHEAVAAH